MKQAETTLAVATRGQGFYDITAEVAEWVSRIGMGTGLLTVFCRHTSASLTIQENADPAVLTDLAEFLSRLVPEKTDWFRHTMEGPDDMPAHIRALLTGVSLSVPISRGRMVLGTWQGIYLIEHRHVPHTRSLALHAMGA